MLRSSGWMLCVVLTALSVFVADATAAEYKLSGQNTKIAFEGAKKDGKHVGSFPKLSGSFNVADDLSKSKIAVKIDMEGLESDDAKLTGHLKSPDFFETKKYPEAKFESKSFTAEKDGYKVTGELTMHGKTKEISFPAKVVHTQGSATLSSEFSIKRSEWGITYKLSDIEDVVKMTIDVKVK